MMGIICFSGHMLLNLSRDKQDFLKEVVESFANRSGQSALYDAVFSRQLPKDSSFLGNDDIGSIDVQEPDPDELARYDVGKWYFSKERLCILILLRQEISVATGGLSRNDGLIFL